VDCLLEQWELVLQESWWQVLDRPDIRFGSFKQDRGKDVSINS